MEILDILDEEGKKTGKTIQRGKTKGQDEYHLLVQVWIKNSKGEFLISKRSPNKNKFPNMWETSIGAVVAGEDSFTAVLREVKEEIGIELTPEKGKYLFRSKRDQEEFRDFIDIWLFKEEIDISKVVYQPEEVCGAKWATPNEIRILIESGEFTDTFTYLEDILN